MPGGRKDRYEEYVQPRLNEVTKWIQEGAKEEYVADELGVAISTFNAYKKRNKELKDAIKKGRCKLVTELKGSMKKKALGFKEEEKKTHIKIDADGNEFTNIEILEKYYPPDVAALNLLLKNTDRFSEKENPDGWLNDPAYYQLRKEEIELRKQLAEAKEWVTGDEVAESS